MNKEKKINFKIKNKKKIKYNWKINIFLIWLIYQNILMLTLIELKK